MPARSWIIIVALVLGGCPRGSISGDDDTGADDDTTGDDDQTAHDDDDDTGDDDTTADCHTTAICSETFLAISSEADLAAIAHCVALTGDLSFDHQAWLTHIELPCLQSVGDLDISGNDNLTTVTLTALTTIERDLTLYDLASLVTFDGLAGLTQVGGAIHIFEAHVLADLGGLSGLTTVGGDLAIEDNDSLASCHGLASVTSVGGSLFLYDNRCLAQAEAEACTAHIDVGGNGVVHSNGEYHPCS